VIVLQGNKWVVMDTSTKAVVSEHPFTSDYEKAKAKDAALKSNQEWKSRQ
jgi:hypothetical protein